MKDSQLKSIIQWIKEHPLFKWSGMCREIGFDKGNFQKIINGQSTAIKDDVVDKIVEVLKKYGYMDESEKAEVKMGKALMNVKPVGPMVELKDLTKKSTATIYTNKPMSDYMKQRQQSKQSKK